MLYWPLKALGDFLKQLAMYEEALHCYEQAIECLDAGQLHKQGIRLYDRLARCCKRMNDLDRARKYAEQAYELFHNRSGLDKECFKQFAIPDFKLAQLL